MAVCDAKKSKIRRTCAFYSCSYLFYDINYSAWSVTVRPVRASNMGSS